MLKIDDYEIKYFVDLYPMRRNKQLTYSKLHANEEEFKETVRKWTSLRFWYRGYDFPEGNLIKSRIPMEYVLLYLEYLKKSKTRR